MTRRSFLSTLVLALVLVLAVVQPSAAAEPIPKEQRRCGSAAVMQKQLEYGPIATAEVLQPTLLTETNVSYLTSSGSFETFRIGIFTEDLTLSTRYCTAVGETRPDYQGNSVVCTADDVLTATKKNILVNQLLPQAVKMHTDRLLVHRNSAGFVVPDFSTVGGICSQFTIPSSHQTTGVTGYDFVLYVAAGPTSGNTIAWALTCATDTTEGRPVVGMTNISPKYIIANDETIRTVTHEIAHALGFNWAAFQGAGMTEMLSVRGKPAGPQLKSANVVAVGKSFFAYSGLTSVELEDEGGAGTAYSHWKRRNLKNELMAGIQSIGYYTAFTLAAFEDLGYYKADFSKAETMPWGYESGSNLLTEKCVIDGVSQYPDMFCTSVYQTFACTEDHMSIGHCRVEVYNADFATYYQYFSDPAAGGTAMLMDYCPVISAYSNTGCSSGKLAAMPGSLLSSTSRCLDSEDGVTVSGHSTTAVCANVKCDTTTETYKVKFLNGEFVDCPAGTKITPSVSSTSFKSGTVYCPAYLTMCSMNEESSKNAAVPLSLMLSPSVQPFLVGAGALLMMVLAVL